MQPRFRLWTLVLAALWLAELGRGQELRSGVHKEILILNSYHSGYEWTDELNRGLRSILEAQDFEAEIWVEFLDTRRRPGAEHLAAERERLSRKYRDRPINLLISTDDDTTTLLSSGSDPMFGHTPVVFCGVSGVDLVERLPRSRFTGLIEAFDLDTLLDQTLKIFPRRSQVVVVTDNAPANAAHHRSLIELSERRRDIHFEYLDGTRMGFEEILAALRLVPPDALVIASSFTHDKESRYLAAFDSGQRIAAASRAPVVSQNTSRLGQGFLVGNTNVGYQHGRVAAQMALRVLRGEPPASIGLQKHGALQMLVDYAALKRFGLSPSSFPAGTRIVNRPADWSDYYASNPLVVWAALGFILLQFGIIAALFVNTERRRRAELALRRSQAQLQHSQKIARLGSWERDVSANTLRWSDEVYSIYGETRATFEPTFDLMLERIHPEDRERIRTLSKEADTSRRDRTMEYRVVGATGRSGMCRCRASGSNSRTGASG